VFGRDTGDLPIMKRSGVTLKPLVGAWGRAVRTSGGRVKRGLAGRRKASGLPGTAEVGLMLGAS